MSNHRQRNIDLLPRRRGQLPLGEPLAFLDGHQIPMLREPVVIDDRLDPLLPLGALMRDQVPAADSRAQVEDVRGRDPRLREPTDQQQLPQMSGVRPVGLRAFLLAAHPARLGRLCKMHLSAGALELLDHEPPARRRLQRNLKTLASEPTEERADGGAVRWGDPCAGDLARDGLDPLG